MHEFKVWAPLAQRVALQVDGVRHAMERGDRGWWHAAIESAGPGSDYGFLLDDREQLLPDPRSQWQPDGVHAPSRVFDAFAFRWTDADWQPKPLRDAVIYELHIGTFTAEGTLDSAIGKLQYLSELGVTHVEIMPVAAFEGDRGWGYDGVFFYAVQHCYGGPPALQRFVNACHQHGLACLLDVVYNHFGPSGNYAPQFAPYLSEQHSTPWSSALNLEDAHADGVRDFLCANAMQWLRDFHFDGLRLDAVDRLVDRSAIHLLQQLSADVAKHGSETGRELVLIAEYDLNDPRLVTPLANGGLGMDAQWSDDFHHALFALLTGERATYYADFGSVAQLAKSLTQAYCYDGIYSAFRQRVQGAPVAGLPADRFLGYIQNHDQIGNRAFGERLHHIAGAQKAKLAAAVVFTAPFVPMIFMGEEFAASSPFQYFTDFKDEQLGKSVSEGRRKEHARPGVDWHQVPDPQSPETMQRSQLCWPELAEPEHAAILAWYRSLIRLRAERDDLRDTNLSHIQLHFDEKQRWLTMLRGDTLVAFNFSEEPRKVPSTPMPKHLLLSSGSSARAINGSIWLPAWSAAVFATD